MIQAALEPLAGAADAEAAQDAARYMAAVKVDPVGWMNSALGLRLWSKQAESARLIADNDRVAIKSGHAVGKSFLSAAIGMWYSEGHCPSNVIYTSSSWSNIEDITWPEVHKMWQFAPYKLGGRMLNMRWNRGTQWSMFSASPDKPENFSGFRAPHGTMIIVDEASALTPDIMEAILGLAISAESKILLIGNPLRPSGPFYDAFRSGSWATMTISSMDVPNVVEGKEIIPGLATRDRIEELARQWGGRDTPQFKARVLGEFPDVAADMLIPLSWIEAAHARKYPPDIDRLSLCMGVDVAREGGDRIVFAIRDAHAVRYVESRTHQSTMTTAGMVIHLAAKWGIRPQRVFLDDAGVGGGVTDRLREQDFGLTAVNFGCKASEPKRFANLRAESYWHLREWLDPKRAGRPGAIPPEYKELGLECAMPKIDYTSQGATRIKLEPKEGIRKRLGRSPDLADALAMTFAEGTPFSMYVPGELAGEIEHPMRGEEVDARGVNRERMMSDDGAWA